MTEAEKMSESYILRSVPPGARRDYINVTQQLLKLGGLPQSEPGVTSRVSESVERSEENVMTASHGVTEGSDTGMDRSQA
jgi:hypothetical protein